MRDLLAEPAWKEEDLGIPLPDSAHACSVCLPTWDAVIGYEEGREKVTHRMRSGYPRFFRHPLVERLFARAKEEIATEDEYVIVLPTRQSVQRAQRWVELRAETAIRVASFHGLQALVLPQKAKQDADYYWRFSGEVVSSRQAEDFFADRLRSDSATDALVAELGKWVSSKELFVFSSGMASITAVVRSLPGVREGKKTLQLEFPYVDSLKVQEFFGNGVVYLNDATGEPFDEALQRIRRGEFAGVFTEAPSNPLLRTVDLARLSEACREGGTPLIVDDSVAGPGNVDVLRFADVATGSLTKWLSGGGDVMAGYAAVREDSPFAAAIIETLSAEAAETAPLYAADAEVLTQNVRSYGERIEVVNRNASILAQWLADREEIAEVWHPSLIQADHYRAVMTERGGFGGLLSFVLKNPKKTPKVYDALALSKGPSFGTNFTLVCPYTMLAHYTELDWAEGFGVPSNLLRVSIGCEPIEVITSAFDKALKEA